MSKHLDKKSFLVWFSMPNCTDEKDENVSMSLNQNLSNLLSTSMCNGNIETF